MVFPSPVYFPEGGNDEWLGEDLTSHQGQPNPLTAYLKVLFVTYPMGASLVCFLTQRYSGQLSSDVN